MYLQFLDAENFNVFEELPFRITLSDGTTRTSLHELTKEQKEYLGLYEYAVVTPEFDPLYQQWDGTYIFEGSTATRNIIDRTPQDIKADKLSIMLQSQAAIQQAGFTCTNGIKLQVGEQDLTRFTQLMVGLLAFQPDTVVIRDYDNVNHTVNLAEAKQMLREMFAWGQWFVQDTWAKKDALND